MRQRTVIVIFLFLAACGKKGDPRPPVPMVPRAATDLTVSQRGPEMVLSWSYPALTVAGTPLETIRRIHVYRMVEEMPPSLVEQLAKTGNASDALAGPELFKQLPAPAPEAFEKTRTELDRIESDRLPAVTAGAKIVLRDQAVLRSPDGAPVRYTYAVVTESPSARSALSNLVSIVPVVVANAPPALTAAAAIDGITLTWTGPVTGIDGGSEPSVSGYNVYRYPADGPVDEMAAPVTPAPVTELRHVDMPPLGAWQYVVTAVASTGPPLLQSLPSPSASVEFRDLQPPPVPAGLAALIESDAVRLIWEGAQAPDLAGYKVYRRTGATPVLLTPTPITDLSFRDVKFERGVELVYSVSSIDTTGNESALSSTSPVLLPR